MHILGVYAQYDRTTDSLALLVAVASSANLQFHIPKRIKARLCLDDNQEASCFALRAATRVSARASSCSGERSR